MYSMMFMLPESARLAGRAQRNSRLFEMVKDNNLRASWEAARIFLFFSLATL
jgi:hypothetical protein